MTKITIQPKQQETSIEIKPGDILEVKTHTETYIFYYAYDVFVDLKKPWSTYVFDSDVRTPYQYLSALFTKEAVITKFSGTITLEQ